MLTKLEDTFTVFPVQFFVYTIYKMDIGKYWSTCKQNPLMCLVAGILLLVVIQNCVMDIGLGPWIGKEGFMDSPSVMASQPMGLNETQMAVDDLNLNYKSIDKIDKLNEECLKEFDLSVIVTDHSNAAMEAMIKGVPAIMTNPQRRFSCIEDIENPLLDRTILNTLAYQQWSLTEIHSGQAWSELTQGVSK